jgi:hypothetical protein
VHVVVQVLELVRRWVSHASQPQTGIHAMHPARSPDRQDDACVDDVADATVGDDELEGAGATGLARPGTVERPDTDRATAAAPARDAERSVDAVAQRLDISHLSEMPHPAAPVVRCDWRSSTARCGAVLENPDAGEDPQARAS